MNEIVVYDFDGTIYDGDSTLDFYKFCIRKQINLIKYLPIQLYAFILYKLKLRSIEYFKEKFYIFLKGVYNIDEYLNEFWSKSKSKIKKWYFEKQHNKDVIISASPEFLLEDICKSFNVKKLIATKVDKRNGKLLSKNCKGNEKLKRLNSEINNYTINEFYSDSRSDIYLARKAEKSYFVVKDKIYKWEID